MLIIQICVGSACHIKGAEGIVELFQNYIEANGLEDKVVLQGSFCKGHCNREGVTLPSATIFIRVSLRKTSRISGMNTYCRQ